MLATVALRQNDDHDLVVLGAREPGVELVESFARTVGVVPTTMATARKRIYDSVLIHSYAHWADLQDIVESLQTTHVDYCADGLRNELRFNPPHTGIQRVRSLFYFGYTLHNQLVSTQLGSVSWQTVPVDSLGEFWRWLERERPTERPRPSDVLHQDDLLVAMRYWGRSRMYPTRGAMTAADILGELDLPHGTRRLIVRADPRSLVDFRRMLARIREVLPPDVELTTWADLIGYDASLGSLDVLDRFAYTEHWRLGAFFGYDGTPNILISATQPGTRVIWPSSELIRNAIIDPAAAAATTETIRIQRAVAQQFSMDVKVPEVSTSGTKAAAILDRIDPRSHGGVSDWTRSEVESVILAVLDVVGLGCTADAGETVDRLRGLLADRVRFENLLLEQGSTVRESERNEQGDGR
ncbi:hypothetical protein [Actinotalea subterranea]|uniref:hypothetical protein n=1 Tax=Actinotalea subterranea TaxID=2607497 RepID=UPI0011EE2D2F|nr:hypothetical protein [Actinotalea subterranea]